MVKPIQLPGQTTKNVTQTKVGAINLKSAYETINKNIQLREQAKQQASIDKANEEIRQQQEQQKANQEAASSPFHNPIAFLRGATGLAESYLGVNKNDVLPEDQNAPQQYQDLRAEQIKQQASLAPGKFGLNWVDRAKGAIGEAMKPITSVAGALITAQQATNPFTATTPEQTKQAQAGLADITIGGVQKTGEIASGVGKFGANVISAAQEWAPTEASKREAKKQGISQEEYNKQFRTKIDNNGILNYHPEYTNDVQKGAAEIVDLGTWFIPITRSEKAIELANALAEMPKVAELFGKVPRLVKIGEKLGFAFEAAKDATDVAILNAVQGKSWDEVKSNAEAAGAFGLATHGLGKVFSTIKMKSDLKSIDSFFTKEGKELTENEIVKADNMIKSGTPKSEVIDQIIADRKNESADKLLKLLGEKSAQTTKAIEELKTPTVTTTETKTTPVIEKKVTIEDIKPNAVIQKDGTIAKENLSVLKEKVSTQSQAQTLKEEFQKEYDSLKSEIAKSETGKATKEQAMLLNQAKDSVAAMEELKKVLPTEIIKDIQAKGAAEVTARAEGGVAKPETPTRINDYTTEGIRTRGLSFSTESKALEKNLTEGFSDLPEYTKLSMAEEATRAQDLLVQEPDRAKRIAMGLENAPNGVRANSIYVAVVNDAAKKGDAAIMNQLAKSDLSRLATEAGQDIRILRELHPNNPVYAIRDIYETRLKALEERLGSLEKAKGASKKRITSELKKAAPKAKDWASFINEIKCK